MSWLSEKIKGQELELAIEYALERMVEHPDAREGYILYDAIKMLHNALNLKSEQRLGISKAANSVCPVCFDREGHHENISPSPY